MANRSRSGEFPIASTVMDHRGENGAGSDAGANVETNGRTAQAYDDAATADMPLADTGAAPAEVSPARDISDQLAKARVKSALFQKPRQMVKISRFVLIERIARGGMGEVYAAYDGQLDRKVAIKLLRPDLRTSSSNARERLLREAQSLARVSHPNVVQVYEAGEAGDQVYVAMELLRGTPLHTWLEQYAGDRDRHWRVILETFIAAGRGLAAVHAADLLHRDFKPANVLVGADGRVCVVDFGLARAARDAQSIETALASGSGSMPETKTDAKPGAKPETKTDAKPETKTDAKPERNIDARREGNTASPAARGGEPPGRLTQSGMLVGTPAYMAPEQISGGEVDHRSDQFSFCVALYEALYGIRPFPGEDFSTLRDSLTSGEILAPPAQTRVPGWIWRVLARGLATDPDQRYPGMAELLAALERVTTRKRRRWMAAAALLCGGMLAGGGAVVGTHDRVACAEAAETALADAWDAPARARVHASFAATGVPYAETVWTGVEHGIDGYIERWQGERMAACRATHVDEIQTQHELALRNRCLDGQAQRLQGLIDRFAHADASLVEKAHDALATMDGPETCSNVAALRSAPPPPDPTSYSDIQALYAALDLARVHAIAGRFDQALQLADQQVEVARAMGYAPAHARALYHAGDIRLDRAAPADVKPGIAMLHEALDLAEAAGDDPLAADIWSALFHRREGVEDPGQLAFWARRALALTERMRDQGVRRAQALHNLGTAMYRQQQDYEAAAARQLQGIELARSASAPPLLVAAMLHDRANTLQQLARHAEARAAYEEAMAITRAVVGDAHPRMLTLRLDYAQFLIQSAELSGESDAGAMERARAYLEQERVLRTQYYGPESAAVAKVHLVMATHDIQRQAFDSAERHLVHILDIHERARGRSHPDLAEPLMFLGLVCFYTGRHEQALGHWQRERDLRLAEADAQPETLGVTESNIGEALFRLGRHADALDAFDRAQRQFDQVASVHPAYLALVNKGRGQALLALDRPLLAVDYLERALSLGREHSLDRLELADTLWSLARALRAGRPDAIERARGLATEARAIYESGDGMRERAAEIAAWLRH
jgi:serine/threonine protein kinase/tetratricopeptide (TPR) repeat protein